MLTDEQLAAIEARCDAAKDCEEWGRPEAPLTWTPEHRDANGQYHEATIWFDDGDSCAYVHNNMGLGYGGDEIAAFFAGCWQDVPALLAEVRRLQRPMLTDADIAAIAARHAAARDWDANRCWMDVDEDGRHWAASGPDGTKEEAMADAAWAAATRGDVAALLEEVRRLRAVNAEWVNQCLHATENLYELGGVEKLWPREPGHVQEWLRWLQEQASPRGTNG